MHLFAKLTEENFYHYAVAHYHDPQSLDPEDFHQDLETFKYLKKLLSRYSSSGEAKERLILNHIILLTNVFGVFPAIRMMFFKVPPKHHSTLKTCLLYLGHLTKQHADNLLTIDSINTHRMLVDPTILSKLRQNEKV